MADYVPFYFAPRSPMLYAIHQNLVEGYNGTQEEVVHLCASAEVVAQNAMPYFFTDGHAEMVISGQFEELAELTNVDWSIMKGNYFGNVTLAHLVR